MHIGIPREIKNGEHRVSLTPAGAARLVQHGHSVMVEHNAGVDSGFDDARYQQAGAIIVDAKQAWACPMVVKVKEPLPAEYGYLRSDLMLLTYLHLAACPELQQHLLDAGVCAIAYETVQTADGALPLLAPMSQIAGRVAVTMGMHWLMRENTTDSPGAGRICGGIDGVEPVSVLIIGGGNVGSHAAQLAAGMGAIITVVEANSQRAEQLRQQWPTWRIIAPAALDEALPHSQLLIGAALIPGARAPQLLNHEHLASMADGSVFVDVAIDQGGISVSSHPSSYDAPLYRQHGVLHCCLPNLPAAVPVSSTQALTTATLPYIIALADLGLERACQQKPELRHGINLHHGQIIHPALRA